MRTLCTCQHHPIDSLEECWNDLGGVLDLYILVSLQSNNKTDYNVSEVL